MICSVSAQIENNAVSCEHHMQVPSTMQSDFMCAKFALGSLGVFGDDDNGGKSATDASEPLDDDNYAAAMEAYKEKRFDRAIKAIQKFLRKEPDSCWGNKRMAQFHSAYADGNAKTA
jgi:TolA-binding protein